MGFVDALVGQLPFYVLLTLFFSWMIWAYCFNKKKSFYLNGNITSVTLILHIFFVLIVCVGLWLGWWAFFGLAIMKANSAEFVSLLQNFQDNIAYTIGALIIFFVIYVRTTKQKDVTSQALQKYCGYLVIALTAGVFILFGLTVAAYFSSYYFLTTALLTLNVGFFILMFVYGVLGAPIFASDFAKFLKVWWEGFFSKAGTVIAICVIIFSAALFTFMLPHSSWQTKNNSYVIRSENSVYLQSDIINVVNNIGWNTRLSNWIPLHYDGLNLSQSLDNGINQDMTFNVNYANGSKLKRNVRDILSGNLRDSWLIEDNSALSLLLISTTTSDLRNSKVEEIRFSGYAEVALDGTEVKVRRGDAVSEGGKIRVQYRILNNLPLNSCYDNFLLGDLGVPSNSTGCKFLNLTTTVGVKGEYKTKTVTSCGPNYCDTFDNLKDFQGTLHTGTGHEGSVSIILHAQYPQAGDNLLFDLWLTC